jgi:hypothetical protein
VNLVNNSRVLNDKIFLNTPVGTKFMVAMVQNAGHWPGGTKEDHGKPIRIAGLRDTIEAEELKIRSRILNTSVATFD